MTFNVMDHVPTLVKLGFSTNQAKVYLTLAYLGTSPASGVTSFSKVPREEVYRKLNELQKMGFVECILTRPEVFRSIPIKSVISTMRDLRIEEDSKLENDIGNLLYNFKHFAHRTTKSTESNKPEIILIPDRKPFLRKTKREFENLKNSLDIVYSWDKGVAWISNLFEFFMKALDKNVKVRYIIEKNEEMFPTFVEEIQKNPLFQIKTIQTPPLSCLSIYDQKIVSIDTSIKNSYTETPAIWSNNPTIVGITKVYFETEWLKAK